MTADLGIKKIELGKLGLKIYGPDKKLLLPNPPGRLVNGVWSPLHEVGDRQLIFADEIDSHSFVRNFENHLYVQQAMDSDTLGSSTYGAGTLGFKDKGGTGRSGISPSDITNSGTAGASGSGYRGASGSDTHGILVGTSTAAFSFEGFELTAQVAEGTCTGEMSHVAMADYTAANVVYNSCTLKWTTTYERFFNNNVIASIEAHYLILRFGNSTLYIKISICA